MAETDRRLEYMRLDAIQRAPRNPKRHDLDAIQRSTDKFGVVEVPALDERTGKLVAGHGRLDAWSAAAQRARHLADAHSTEQVRTSPAIEQGDSGWSAMCWGCTPEREFTEDTEDGALAARDAHIAEVCDLTRVPAGVRRDDDGMWMVPVLRGWASATDAEAEAYLVASNQLTIAGGWDDTELATLLEDLRQEDDLLLQVTGIDDAQLEQLLTSTDTLSGPATSFLSQFTDPFGGSGEQPPPQGPPAVDWTNETPTALPGQPGDPLSDDQGTLAPNPAPTGPADDVGGYGPNGTASEYAPMSWVMHRTDRAYVRAALRHMQKARDLATSGEAIVAICRDYVTQHALEVTPPAPAEEPQEVDA